MPDVAFLRDARPQW